MTEQDRTPQDLTREQIRPTKRNIENALIARPGVVGVDIGEKWSDGRPTGRQAIVVHVERKLGDGEIAEQDRIPATIDGVPTDVVEHRVRLLSSSPAVGERDVVRGRVRPLAGGLSLGPADPVTVPVDGHAQRRSVNGTLGVVVTDRLSGRALGLTNWHVAAGDGLEDAGSTWIQPALADGGDPRRDRVGALVRGALTDTIDAAVVALAPGAPWVPGVLGIGAVTGAAAAAEDGVVRKYGRTTGLRTGRVVSTDYTTSVDFGPGTGWRTLRDQIRIEPDEGAEAFSSEGDSGSAVVDEHGRVVALLWAGEDDGSYSVASPIADVLDTLGVDVATVETARAAAARRLALARRERALAARRLLARRTAGWSGPFPPVSAAFGAGWRAATSGRTSASGAGAGAGRNGAPV
ncbi:trypsin-like peptidase domain-containing protein, partial [Cellulomonas sp.]|uniref:trypsin-like peptidase domain-containing protein n=1 Tax=Cellulomonas sp. TaxID=40001 RepID=UPI001B2E1912|nr:peptidase S32 [Cellulomonas sp.]